MTKRGLKPATIHQTHRTLRAALNEAVRRGQIVKNPALTAKAPRLVEEEIEPFTVEEAKRVLVAASHGRNGVRFALAPALGLRQGEALGLQWPDVDEKNDTLTIRRALQRHTWRHGCGGICERKRGADCPDRSAGGLVEVPPKSRAGRRVVGVPPQLMKRCWSTRKRSKPSEIGQATCGESGGWVFAQPSGKPTDPCADYAEWRALLNEAKVRAARLHDARHTAATM